MRSRRLLVAAGCCLAVVLLLLYLLHAHHPSDATGDAPAFSPNRLCRDRSCWLYC